MIRTNLDQCVEMAIAGTIQNPSMAPNTELRAAADGSLFSPGAPAGLVLNVKVGDSALGWVGADEVEPGASLSSCDCGDEARALEALSCVGNDAIITDATFDNKDVKLKGIAGVVTGKSHGRVNVHFPKRILEKLVPGDRIAVRAQGSGLKLLDYADVAVFNVGPKLLRAMNLSEKGGKVRVQVTKIIPGRLVGSGAGSCSGPVGHFDIQSTSTDDQKTLEQIRLGDLVTITDLDSSRGVRWEKGAVTIGIVCHGSSRRSGHGIGVNVLLSSAKGQIEAIIMSKANLANYLSLG